MKTSVADEYAAIAQRLREIDAERRKAEEKPAAPSQRAGVMDGSSRAPRIHDAFYKTRRHP